MHEADRGLMLDTVFRAVGSDMIQHSDRSVSARVEPTQCFCLVKFIIEF